MVFSFGCVSMFVSRELLSESSGNVPNVEKVVNANRVSVGLC